ncbi:MAG: Spy/CpxP family protein refolding chaperone [Gemmatimonadetes bacterium]|nr:Spy/CpxP family protein refolding chaperone [Gemmatimonadota bacterium]
MNRAYFSRIGVVAGVLGLMVVMGAAPGVEAQRWGGGNRGGGGWGAGWGAGMRGGGGNFSVESVIRLADELDLSAAQQEQLEAIRVELLETQTSRAVRQMEMISEIRAGIREPEALRADAMELAGQARETLGGMRERYDAILTEEQREELRQLNRRTAWRGDRDARDGRGRDRFDRVRDARGRGTPDRWQAAMDRWRGAMDRGGRGRDDARPGRPGGGPGS